jgi:RHS repeat-associated protein
VGGVSAWYNLRLGWSVLNEESGTGANLYFAPYRYYNPQLARWMSRDPLGMVDGPNVYAYVKGMPVAYTDPLGLALTGWKCQAACYALKLFLLSVIGLFGAGLFAACMVAIPPPANVYVCGSLAFVLGTVTADLIDLIVCGCRRQCDCNDGKPPRAC